MIRRNLLKENSGLFEVLQRLFDPFLVIGAGIAIFAYQFGHLSFPADYVIMLTGAFLLCLIVFSFFDIYRFQRGASLWLEMRNVIGAWLTVIAILAVLLFATKAGTVFSRLWFGRWVLSGMIVLVVFRMGIRGVLRLIRRHGFNLRFIAIAGAGELGRGVLRRLSESPWVGLKVVGLYDDDSMLQHQQIEGISVRGGLDRLPDDVAELGIDQVWIALPLQHGERVRSLVNQLSRLPVQVSFIPDIYGFQLLNHSIGEVVGFPVIHLMQSPLSGINGFLKAIEDRLLAALILLMGSPLMAMIMVGIKLSSPGPIFFKQLRGGLQGERIWVWKFRTMKCQNQAPGQTVIQATPGDRRITAFGAFLRRTSLDELPQFINVLKGDMSIVGPRPHAVEHDQFYRGKIDAYMLRHHVKPGISGWAQVNGWRGETGEIEKMEMRIRHDLYYLNNWSIGFDLRIILLTAWALITGKNAH